jgi:hypothetical protein
VKRTGLIALTLVLVVIQHGINLVSDYRQRHPAIVYGVSFSTKQASHLGLDWRQTYSRLLDDLRVRHLRLMSYWDEVEPRPGEFNFEHLDWQVTQASQRGASVSLAVGLRQPRWPECHYPSWWHQLPDIERRTRLMAYLEMVVRRYREQPAVKQWQLENEALNRGFGECQPIKQSDLAAELALIKSLSSKPATLTLSDEGGLPLRGPKGDKVGYSVYKRYYYSGSLGRRYVTYPLPAWYHTLKAAIVERYMKRGNLIHELQAEPWGPKAIPQLSSAEQDQTMSYERFEGMISYSRAIGVPEVYLWGAEWWDWRRQQGDTRFWERAGDLF